VANATFDDARNHVSIHDLGDMRLNGQSMIFRSFDSHRGTQRDFSYQELNARRFDGSERAKSISLGVSRG
jgi:hypothetical protein